MRVWGLRVRVWDLGWRGDRLKEVLERADLEGRARLGREGRDLDGGGGDHSGVPGPARKGPA